MKIKNPDKGFTLVELIIVIVILGILATIATARFSNIIVKAKISKAKNGIALLVNAEKMYRSENDAWVVVNAGSVDADIGSSVTGVGLGDLDQDPDFSYSVNGAYIVCAIARRVVGKCAAGTLVATFNLNSSNRTEAACGQ